MMMALAIGAKVVAGATAVAGAAGAAAGAVGGAVAAAGGAISAGVGSVASALGIGGGAAGGAVGAAGAAGGGGASALALAQGVGGAFQAFANFSASRADAQQLEQQAYQERLLGVSEAREARNAITSINHEFLQIAGQQRLAFASNGFDLGSGSVKSARGRSLDEANRQIGQTVDNATILHEQREARAAGFKKSAAQTRKSGLFGLAGSAFNIGAQVFGGTP